MLKRPRPRFLMTLFSLSALLILLLGACGAPQGGGGGTGTGGTAVKGGTWIDDLYEEPDSLIPNASSETFSDMVDQTIYTPLFVGDSHGQVHPALATEIPTIQNGGISSDLKTWTFHLRKGLKWSDGQPLDARDVDYTWKTWVDPKFGANSTIGLNLITSADVSSDNLSITFHLKQPFSPFVTDPWVDGLNALLPMHHFQGMKPEQITKSADNLNPSVTNGPFKMSESKPGDHYTVVRDPMWYRASEGVPYLDSIVFRIVPDQNTILKDLQAGSINSSWFLDVSKTPAFQRLTNYSLSVNSASTNFEAAYFNFKNPILGKHQEVRQAIAMAIDHQAMIDVARRGQAVPLCTDHGAGLNPGYQKDAPCPKFDVAGANALLDQNGWTKGSDGYRSKGGQRLEFQYSTTANNLWRADDELIMQQNMKAIGIKLDIQNYPASTFFGNFLLDGVPGKYDIAEFENTFGYDADDASVAATSQIPPNGFNIMFYSNPNLDKLYIAEQSTADPAQRQQIFNQIHQIYLTDFPFITLYSPQDIALVKKNTHNYAPAPGGASETINNWEWWCDNGKC
jgi:peptide/nickel transport system substrate-binding protein